MSRVSLAGALVTEVESDSIPGKLYTVRRRPDGTWSCDCPGFEHHEHCKHIKRGQEKLLKERDRLRKVMEVLQRFDYQDVQQRLRELDVLGDE